MARPIKVIPTLEGAAAATFLKRAEEAERRYKERKATGEGYEEIICQSFGFINYEYIRRS